MIANHRVLIKVGGAALKDDSVLETVTQAIQRYRRNSYKVVIVHGGGPAINAALEAKGIMWTFVDGQRVTSPEMMTAIETTLCGEVNRKLVRHMGGAGLPVVGFSGTDNHTLMCTRQSEALGQVGEIQAVNCAWIEVLMRLPSAPIPVMAPVGIGHNGEAFNINADWAATKLAVALGVEQLIFFTDQKGILGANKKLIEHTTPLELQALMDDGTIQGGMMTKARSIIHACKSGIPLVRVLNGVDALDAVNDESIGTVCTAPALVEAPKVKVMADATI
jgi:acetylglutamate kinase